MTKKWKFRQDILGQYINSSSNRTFQEVEDRINYLESKYEEICKCFVCGKVVREYDDKIPHGWNSFIHKDCEKNLDNAYEKTENIIKEDFEKIIKRI